MASKNPETVDLMGKSYEVVGKLEGWLLGSNDGRVDKEGANDSEGSLLGNDVALGWLLGAGIDDGCWLVDGLFDGTIVGDSTTPSK